MLMRKNNEKNYITHILDQIHLHIILGIELSRQILNIVICEINENKIIFIFYNGFFDKSAKRVFQIKQKLSINK